MGILARPAMKRSTTAEDGDMALALALHQTELQQAARQAAGNARQSSGQATPSAPSFVCGGAGNFDHQQQAQVWHDTEVSPPSTSAEPALWVDGGGQLERTFSRKLSNVKYSKHLPRVNSHPLSPEDSSTARDRLLSRLGMYGLCEVSVSGDGNCQFRAVADQLYRSPNEHGYVRAAVVAQLSQYPHLYYEYIPESYQAYCEKMNTFGTWGDHVTLQAAADAFGVRIVIMTSYRDSCVVEIQPQGQVQSQRILYLSFWAEVHYNSVYPEGEAPQYQDYQNGKVLGSKKLGRFFMKGV